MRGDILKKWLIPILFLMFIGLGCVGTIITNGKYIAWNVVKNSEAYLQDDNLFGHMDSYIVAFETALNESVFLKELYVDVFGMLQKTMRKEVIPHVDASKTIVKGSDEKLYFASTITVNNATNVENGVDVYANALIQLQEVVRETGGELLYVQAPQKWHQTVRTPINIDAENMNLRAEKLVQAISGQITTINLMQEIEKQSLKYEDLFYATDHHWTTETAFWCFQQICLCLNDSFDWKIEETIYDSQSWSYHTLKEAYLGTTGVRVGKYFVGKDDYTLIVPKFPTQFVRTYLSTDLLEYSGDFSHALLNNYDQLIGGDYKSLKWGTYTGSDSALVKIDNLDTSNEKKILVIKDSFALPVCAFLGTVSKQVQIYDLRYPHESSVVDYIKQEQFDIVMFLYNPEAINGTMFRFFGNE